MAANGFKEQPGLMKISWIITVKSRSSSTWTISFIIHPVILLQPWPSLIPQPVDAAAAEAKQNKRLQHSKEVGRRKKRTEIHANSRWPAEGRGIPLFEIFVLLLLARPPARPASLPVSAIKVLTLLNSSFLWPPSSVPGLRSPSASNSSSFIETNRLEVTPGRARRWLAAARGRSEWRVFICLGDAAGIHLLQRHPVFWLLGALTPAES